MLYFNLTLLIRICTYVCSISPHVIYSHTILHTYTNAHAHAYTYSHMHIHTHTYTHTHTHTHTTAAISVPAFSGQSFLTHTIPPPLVSPLTISLSLRTRTTTGLILYATGESNALLSLGLQDGILVFQFGSSTGLAEIRTDFFPVADGSWYSITVTWDGQSSSLTINSGPTFTATLSAAVDPSSLGGLIFVGGIPDFSVINPAVMQNSSFVGCITDFVLNGQTVSLLGGALSGAGITECIMGACTSTTCQNDGICVDDTTTPVGFYCSCSLGFAGDTCQQGTLFTMLFTLCDCDCDFCIFKKYISLSSLVPSPFPLSVLQATTAGWRPGNKAKLYLSYLVGSIFLILLALKLRL